MDEHGAMTTNFERESTLFGAPDPADVEAYRPWIDARVAHGDYGWAQEWLAGIQARNASAEDTEGLRALIDATYLRCDVALREATTAEAQEARSQPWSPLEPEEIGLEDARLALEWDLPRRLQLHDPGPSIYRSSANDSASHRNPDLAIGQREREAYRAEALGQLLVGRLTTFRGAASTSRYRRLPYEVAYDDLQRAGSAASKVDLVDVATAAARNAALHHSPREEGMWRSRTRRALGHLAAERVVDGLFGGFPSASKQLQAARAIATARAYRPGDSGDARRSVNLNP